MRSAHSITLLSFFASRIGELPSYRADRKVSAKVQLDQFESTRDAELRPCAGGFNGLAKRKGSRHLGLNRVHCTQQTGDRLSAQGRICNENRPI